MTYITLATFKTYRGITSSKDDVLLQSLITRAQQQIDSYTGRTFEASSTAAHYFDAVLDVSDDHLTLYLNDDLCAIESVVNGDSLTVNSTAYVPVPRMSTPYYALRMKRTAANWWTYDDEQEDAITVTGYWAYSTRAPADIQQATVRLAAYMYAQKDANVFDTTVFPEAGVLTVPQGMPRDVREILDPYRRIR